MALNCKRRICGTRRRTRSVGSMPLCWQNKYSMGVQSDEMGASSSTSKEKGYYQSDSDDISSSVPQNIAFQIYSKYPDNMHNMESDSLNENSPCRPSARRKRKFKKLAVDTDAKNPNRFYAHCLTQFSKKKQRAIFKHAGITDNRFWPVTGKRKRIMREKGLITGLSKSQIAEVNRESKVLALSKLSLNDEPIEDDIGMDISYPGLSSSSISSSGSEAGIFTNDEGREGDDEQSDWVGDPALVALGHTFRGPTSTQPPGLKDEDMDSKFYHILTGSFEHIDEAKRSYNLLTTRTGKEISDIRGSRRRGRNYKPNIGISLPVPAVKHSGHIISSPIHIDTSKFKEMVIDSNIPNRRYTFSGLKKRKRMPSSVAVLDTVTTELSEPIMEDNKGNQMLTNVGWRFGDSLGSASSEIQEPVAYKMLSKYHEGLGHSSD